MIIVTYALAEMSTGNTVVKLVVNNRDVIYWIALLLLAIRLAILEWRLNPEPIRALYLTLRDSRAILIGGAIAAIIFALVAVDGHPLDGALAGLFWGYLAALIAYSIRHRRRRAEQ